MMNREEFLRRCEDSDLKTIEVETERFGTLRFRQLDNFQKVERWDEVLAPGGKHKKDRIPFVGAIAIIATLVDETGNQMLKVSDMQSVSRMFAGELENLVEVARYCIGLDGTNEPEIVKKKLPASETTTVESAS